MDKEVLAQYCAIEKEIKVLERQIAQLEHSMEHPTIVSDTVKGSREDLTIGLIKVSGIPDPEYDKKEKEQKRHLDDMNAKKAELSKQVRQVEEFIESIPDSKLRIMFRLRYKDGMKWVKVAHKMTQMFPNDDSYTPDGCRMKRNRILKKIK